MKEKCFTSDTISFVLTKGTPKVEEDHKIEEVVEEDQKTEEGGTKNADV